MAKKVSSNDIRNINEEWAFDDRNNFPYSGASIQRFIKKTFGEKIGCIYYDGDITGQYLMFADGDSRDIYLDNREEHASLLLGSFDAPAPFTAEINMISPISNIILKDTKDNLIEFTFQIINRSGSPTGEPVTVTYNMTNNGNTKKVTQVYNVGEHVKFNVDEYLSRGENIISIVVTGRDSNASTRTAVSYTVVDLSLSSTFDFTNGVQQGAMLAIPYTISGYGVKYVEWYIDGEKAGNDDTVTDSLVTRTKNIDTSNIAYGKHSLQARAKITDGTDEFYSNVLYYDFVISPVNDAWVENVTYVLLGLNLNSLVIESISINAEQYKTTSFETGVYDSRKRTLELAVKDNNVVVKNITIEPDQKEVVEYTPTTTGSHVITLESGGATASIDVAVSVNEIDIHEETEGLILKLSGKGRSNNEVNRDVWTYGSYSTVFNGFEWNEQSGWNDGGLAIPAGSSIDINLAPLTGNTTTLGRTIEIDFETSKIEDENASVLSLMNSTTGAGINITASSASLQSNGGANVNTKFRGGDRVHLALIINRVDGDDAQLMYIVNNGILERANNFAASASFQASDNIHIGSTGCDIKLYSIRVYDKALTVDQAFGNFAVDSDNMLQVVARNDIYNKTSGAIDVDKINSQIPVMIITGDMQPIFDATTKDATVFVDIDYRNLQDSTKNFTATHVRMRPQGTSSLQYPRKNLRPYTASKYECVMLDYEGNVIEDGLYAFKDGAQPVNCWTLKADYAESSGSHNTGVARLWNDVMYNARVNNEFVLRTEAQKAAKDNGYNYDVRTTVDGFPIVVFHRITADAPLTCLGQYNFNNDKSTEKVFGFTDIPGFDNSNVQCFEFLDSSQALANFTDVSRFDEDWDKSFESRYPDTETPNLTPLKTLATWINACSNNQEKWNTEKAEHFDLYKLAAYYVYLMRFGAVDQTVKNAMITTEDGQHWFFINYDNDTILGIDNASKVFNAWDYDRQSKVPVTGEYYYAGHDSVLWNCFEADDECMAYVKTIDAALYSAGLTYENMIRMFDDEQASQWCERMYNENGRYKYIDAYKSGAQYLHMLQGSRESYRHWWLQHRMDKYDAIWTTAAYKNRQATVRFNASTDVNFVGNTITITTATASYFGYGINNNPQPLNNDGDVTVWLEKGETYVFNIANVGVGNPVNLYNANNIASIQLSNDAVALVQTFDLKDARGNDGKGSIKRIILGDGVSENNALHAIGGLSGVAGYIDTIEEIDIRGFKSIATLDLSKQKNLHVFNAANSGLTEFAPAEGVRLDSVTLLDIQGLQLNKVTLNSFSYNPNNLLRSVVINGVKGTFDVKDFILDWVTALTDEELAAAELTATNLSWTDTYESVAIAMGKVGIKRYTGKIVLKAITFAGYSQLVSLYGMSVFNASSSFVIDAPSNFILIGPNEIVQGGSGKYSGTVFPVTDEDIIYRLYDTSNNLIPSETDEQGRVFRKYEGVTVYEATGAVSVDMSITEVHSMRIRALAMDSHRESNIVTTTTKLHTYPEIVVSGVSKIEEDGRYTYLKSFDTDDFTATVTDVSWSLDDTSVSTLGNTDANSAVVIVNGLTKSVINNVLTCTVTFNTGVVKQDTIAVKMLLAMAYIDMGLPSGTLWAEANVGAAVPEEYGLYFSWGNTQGYVGASNEFNESGYKASAGYSIDYCLDLEHDAARITLEDDTIQMPTQAMAQELIDNCTIQQATVNGVSGMEFMSNINSNVLFFPYAGDADKTGLYNRGVECTVLLGTYRYVLYCTNGAAPTIKQAIEHATSSTDISLYGGYSIRSVRYTPKFVDLGLPSGLLWAESNIGVGSGNYPGYYCDTTTLYAHDVDKRDISGGGESINTRTFIDKYLSDTDYRLPTKDEIQELLDNCTYTYTYTVPGILTFTSKINGNTLSFAVPHDIRYDSDEKAVRARIISSTRGTSSSKNGYYTLYINKTSTLSLSVKIILDTSYSGNSYPSIRVFARPVK